MAPTTKSLKIRKNSLTIRQETKRQRKARVLTENKKWLKEVLKIYLKIKLSNF